MLNTQAGVQEFIQNIRLNSQNNNIQDILNSPQSAETITRKIFQKFTKPTDHISKVNTNPQSKGSQQLTSKQNNINSIQLSNDGQSKQQILRQQNNLKQTINQSQKQQCAQETSQQSDEQTNKSSLLEQFNQYLTRTEQPFVQQKTLQSIKDLQQKQMAEANAHQQARLQQIKNEIQRQTQEEREKRVLKHRQALLEETRKTIMEQQAKAALEEKEKQLKKQMHEQRIYQLNAKADTWIEKKQFALRLRFFYALREKVAKLQFPISNIIKLHNFRLKYTTIQIMRQYKKQRDQEYKDRQSAFQELLQQNERISIDFHNFYLYKKYFRLLLTEYKQIKHRKTILQYQQSQMSKIEAFLKRREEEAEKKNQNTFQTEIVEQQEKQNDQQNQSENNSMQQQNINIQQQPQKKNLKQLSKQIIIQSSNNQAQQNQNQQPRTEVQQNIDPECLKQFKAKPYKKPEEPKFLLQMKEREQLRQKMKEEKEKQKKEKEEQLKQEELKRKQLLQEKIEALKVKSQTIQKDFYQKIALRKLISKYQTVQNKYNNVSTQFVISKIYRIIQQRYNFMIHLTDQRNVKIIQLLSHVYQTYMHQRIVTVIKTNKAITDEIVNNFIKQQQNKLKKNYLQLWNDIYNDILHKEKIRAKQLQKIIYTKTGIYMLKFNIQQNKKEKQRQETKQQLIQEYYDYLEQLNYHQQIDNEIENIFNNMFENNKPNILPYFEYERQWILDKGILNELRSGKINIEMKMGFDL